MTSKWKRSERVQIAVQKSGRLTDHSMALLKRCGIRLTRGADELLAVAENMPVDVLLVRDDEIPGLVREGACDLGIVGLNVAEEQRLGLDEGQPSPERIRDLDFGGCRLSMAYPRDGEARKVHDLNGLRVASSYPRLTGRFLDEAGVSAEVIPFSGAVELAPRLGRAEAICDLVSSGKTLAANQLSEGETVLESRAALLLTRPTCPRRAANGWICSNAASTGSCRPAKPSTSCCTRHARRCIR